MTDIVTLMMVCYNRIELTKVTIDNIYETAGVDFNLVIIDNGSVDGTVEYLRSIQTSKNITLVLNDENKGIATGRNQGLLEADKLDTQFYCTVDNDLNFPKFWLRDCIDLLLDNPGYAFGVNYEPAPYPLVKSKTKDLYFQQKPAGNLGTATTVFRKQLHQMIGFFNTEYSRYYGIEDSDYFMRARVAGFKLGYVEKMGIHLGEDNNEVSEYRKFKTQQHDALVDVFRKNCSLYMNHLKPIYIPFKDSTP